MLSTEKRAWMAVAIYTLFLYSTMTLTFDLYIAVFEQIGRSTMSLVINAVFLVAGLGLLVLVLKKATHRAGAFTAFLLIALAAAFCLYQLPVPAKRIHFFQYAPLTLLLQHAVGFRSTDRYRYIWTIALVAMIGLGDEMLQGLLPKRYFGINDVVVNSVAGLLTLAFVTFVLGTDRILNQTSGPGPPTNPRGSD